MDQNQGGRCVSGSMIREKGRRLLADVNVLLPIDRKINLQFTSGWLWNFQKRWGVKSREMYGEAADADDQAVTDCLPRLQDICSRYGLGDMWNVDETGSNYAMDPDRTICASPVPGRKKEKKRPTLLVCANSSGTEKFPLFFIGSARRPHCFQNKTGEPLGFDYAHIKKAWMTMDLSFRWLLCFDSYINGTTGRKVLLLLDNVSGHGRPERLPDLSCVHVEFLPPNTTSKLQPIDAGIINCVKRRYRTAQYNRALDVLEDGGENIYNTDQLTAMKYLQNL